MIDTDRLLVDILKELGKDGIVRKVIDKALEKQDYQYNDERGCIQDIHTNPLYADFDDPTIFKIGDTIRNKTSNIKAIVTTYLDKAYGLSNGCIIQAKDKDNWEKLNSVEEKYI